MKAFWRCINRFATSENVLIKWGIRRLWATCCRNIRWKWGFLMGRFRCIFYWILCISSGYRGFKTVISWRLIMRFFYLRRWIISSRRRLFCRALRRRGSSLSCSSWFIGTRRSSRRRFRRTISRQRTLTSTTSTRTFSCRTSPNCNLILILKMEENIVLLLILKYFIIFSDWKYFFYNKFKIFNWIFLSKKLNYYFFKYKLN